MSYLMEWWGMVWQLYLKLLAFGNDTGGLVMLLVWFMGTAAAFVAMVVAPVVLVFKLLALTVVLAFKASLVALFVGGAMQVADEVDRKKLQAEVNWVEQHYPGLDREEQRELALRRLNERRQHRGPPA